MAIVMTELKIPESDPFLPTRRSLLSRLRDWDDAESWRQFFDTYGKFIYSFARHSGLSDAEAQDAVQETCVAVARQMPGFRYDSRVGTFKGWLFRIARRRVIDQFRKRMPRGQQEDALDGANAGNALEELPDLTASGTESLWEQEWRRHLLTTALARLKRKVSLKQYQLFDLYVIQGQPTSVVTGLLGVSRAQLYMTKMRVGRLLRHELEQLDARGFSP
jgi:RNA polymerase sigma-70 factor (ECF subfamily)